MLLRPQTESPLTTDTDTIIRNAVVSSDDIVDCAVLAEQLRSSMNGQSVITAYMDRPIVTSVRLPAVTRGTMSSFFEIGNCSII